MSNAKQILLFKTGSISAADMQELRDSGFIPMQVENFDDIKITDPLMTADRSVVFECAMRAIKDHSHATKNPRELFGSYLVAKLLDSNNG